MSKQTELAQVADTITVNSGNVGIGTSSPATALDVLSGSASVGALKVKNASGASASTPILEAINGGGNTRLIVLNDGNVGIGTTSPNTDVEIARSVSPTLRFNNTDTSLTQGQGLGSIEFMNNDASGYGPNVAAIIKAVTTGSGGQNGALDFRTKSGSGEGDAASTSMYISSNGNVGIGTTSPAYSLVVSSGGASGIEFGPAYSGTANLVQHYSRSGNVYVDAVNVAAQHRFFIGGTERMRIDSDGVLKINGGSAWNETNQGTGKGSIHLDPNSTANDIGGAITFGASDSGTGETAMAGIYTRSDGSYGTKMYLATTDSYANGPKTAVKINHSGQVTTPRQCSFSVSKSNGHVSAGTGVVYNVVLNNTGSNYNTSNGRFTAPVQGKYFIATNHMSDNDTTYTNKYYTIKVNGASHQRVYSSSGGAVHHRFSWAGVIALNTGDFIDVFADNVKLYGLHTTYAHFSGHLLG